MLLSGSRVHGLRKAVGARRCVERRILVHVGQEKRLADSWLVVESRAAIPMTASSATQGRDKNKPGKQISRRVEGKNLPDLEVERTVDTVLLRAEDRRQVLCHPAASA